MSLLTLPNGTTLLVDKQGSGPVAIFLHGLGGTHNLWRAAIQQADLPSTHTVITFDIAGHGLSPPNKDHASIVSCVADLDSLISTLGVDKVTLVGQSWGSAMAVIYATMHPEKVAALAVFTMIYTPVPHPFIDRFRSLLATAKHKGITTFADQFVPLLFEPGDGATMTVGTALHAMILSTPAEHYVIPIEEMLQVAPRENNIDWGSFAFPLLLVYGTKDPIHTPDMAEKIKSLCPPTTRLVMWEGLGHSVMLEAPRKTGELLKEFLTSTPA